jgi:hypothetical protein
MSTQITLPAPRRMSWGRAWLVAGFLAATIGLGVTGYVALRHDGVAGSGPATGRVAADFPEYSGSVTGTGPGLSEVARFGETYRGVVSGTGPGLLQIAKAPAEAAPNRHSSVGFRRAAERPGWVAPGGAPGAGSNEGCTFIGRGPC